MCGQDNTFFAYWLSCIFFLPCIDYHIHGLLSNLVKGLMNSRES